MPQAHDGYEVPIRNRRFDTVVVPHLYRIMRDSVERMFYFRKLQDHGVKFIMVKDDVQIYQKPLDHMVPWPTQWLGISPGHSPISRPRTLLEFTSS